MTQQELVNFINKHRDKIGAFHIALDERFEGQFTLGYYYDEKSSQYKVYEVNERQDIWIRDEFKNESDAINRLYRLIKTKFWIKETPIQLDDSERVYYQMNQIKGNGFIITGENGNYTMS